MFKDIFRITQCSSSELWTSVKTHVAVGITDTCIEGWVVYLKTVMGRGYPHDGRADKNPYQHDGS